MTSTFDEIVANFDGETTESFVAQDAEVIRGLPDGTRFRYLPGTLTWTLGEIGVRQDFVAWLATQSGSEGIEILNPEILGEFAPLPETEPGFEELVGDLARKVFDAIGAERMTEALGGLLPNPWLPKVGDQVYVDYLNSPRWTGLATVGRVYVTGGVRVRMDRTGDVGAFDRKYLSPIAESVTVVDEPRFAIGDRVRVVAADSLRGMVGTIVAKAKVYDWRVQLDDHGDSYSTPLDAEELEPLVVKVGDRVEVIETSYQGQSRQVGCTGRVIGAADRHIPGDFRVLMDDVNDHNNEGTGWEFYAHQLRVIG